MLNSCNPALVVAIIVMLVRHSEYIIFVCVLEIVLCLFGLLELNITKRNSGKISRNLM
jgi:hypothetical protein